MITDAPVCWEIKYNLTTPEKTATFAWRVEIDKTHYVLKHGKQTQATGTYRKVVCTNGAKKVRAFASWWKPAKVTITISRWLRR